MSKNKLVLNRSNLFNDLLKHPDQFQKAFPNLSNRIKAFVSNPGSAPCRKVINEIFRMGDKEISKIPMYENKEIVLAPHREEIETYSSRIVKMEVSYKEIDEALAYIAYEEGAEAIKSVFNNPENPKELCIIYVKEFADEPEESKERAEEEKQEDKGSSV